MRCRDIIAILERIAPPAYAESWDNVGLLVGDKEKQVHTVFLAVDATDRVIEEAHLAGADMLVTHHPLIFSGLKAVNEEHFIGRRVRRLIRDDICYYAMHTNFDIAGDMAGLVVKRLPFRESKVLHEQSDGLGIGRIGVLEVPISVRQLAEMVKERFALSQTVLYGDSASIVESVAVVPGSGKSEIGEAVIQGAKLLLTGDIDHHNGIDALAKGLIVLDAGHYGLEKVFVEEMEHRLQKECGGSISIKTERIMQPFTVI